MVLSRPFIHLNNNPIMMASIEEMGQQKEILFYDGAIVRGIHEISFKLNLKEIDKLEEKYPL